MKMTKKVHIILIMTLLVFLIVQAQILCAAEDRVKLHFMSWYFGEEPANTALRTLFEKFEEIYPNIEIVPETVTAAEKFTKFVFQMEGGKGPDIYMETSGNIRAVVHQGYVLSLEPFINSENENIRDRFGPAIIESFSGADGHMYFMPYAIGPVAMIYNTRLWEEAGLDPDSPPTNWDQLLDYLKKLTVNGRYGIALFGKGDGSSVWRNSYWWMTNGADVLNKSGEVTVNTPEFVEGMKYWSSLYHEYKVAPPSVLQNSFSENNAIFASEVAAIVQSGIWQFNVTTKMNPSLEGKIRAALMPPEKVKVAAGGGDDGLCITTASKHPKEAWELLKYLSSEEAGRILWDIQAKFPANLNALDTPKYRSDRLVQMWSGILPYTRAPVTHYRYPEISNVLGVMQQEILLKSKTVEKAVADAHAKIKEIVER